MHLGSEAPWKQGDRCWEASPHQPPSGGWRSRQKFVGTSGIYSFYGMFHIMDRYFEAVSSSRAALPPGWAVVCAFSPSCPGVTKRLGTQSWRFPNTALCLWGKSRSNLKTKGKKGKQKKKKGGGEGRGNEKTNLHVFKWCWSPHQAINSPITNCERLR